MNHSLTSIFAASSLGLLYAHADLVSHYTFDETSGTTAVDSGPAGLDGTIGSNVILGTAGKFGTAFTFQNDASQNGVVDMGNASPLFSAISTNQTLTISAWLKWAAGGTRDSAIFLGDDTASNRYLDVGTASGTGGIYGRIRDGVNTGFSDLNPLPPSPLNDGEWHHVAYTLDAANDVAQLYIDGTLISRTEGTPAVTLPSIFNNFEVGRLGRSAPTDAFEGSIDELRIYDTVLLSGEIAILADLPVGDPSLQLEPAITFDTGGDPQTLQVPFSNLGATQTLSLTDPDPITISGFDASFFEVVSYDDDLAPGASGVITLNFDPDISGLYTVTLSVATNDSLEPVKEIEVMVNVEAMDPVAAVDPLSIDFGSFDESPTSQTQTVTITNNGTENDLILYDVEFTGDPAFTANDPASSTVLPGQSVDVEVTFSPPPGSEGTFTGTLVIDTNSDGEFLFSIPVTAEVKVANPDASLVSLFTFDDAAELGEDTGSFANDGTPMGDAQWSAMARVGAGALLLDGTGDLVDLGVTSGVDYTTSLLSDSDGFTVACWARVPTTATAARTRFFSAYANGAATLTEGWGVGQRSATRQMVGTSYGVYDYLSPADTTPLPGSWRHYSYIFRNSPVNRVDFYVDGVLVHSQNTNTSGINEASTVGFAIGALGRSTAFEGFEGFLDDLRIYSRELTTGNIVDLFEAAPELTGYDEWAAGFGLDSESNGSPTADPDGDGLANSIEFVLGSSPVSGAGSNLPTVDRVDETLVLVYQRELEASAEGFVDRVEFSDDLREGSWTTAVNDVDGVTVAVEVVDAETEQVTVTIPATRSRRFARLSVTEPVQP